MCLLLETIKIKDGKFCNIEFHHARFNKTRADLFGIQDFTDLNESISISGTPASGIYKCRIIYDREIRSVKILPYQIKMINTIKAVQNDQIDYSYKYFDRTIFDKMLKESGSDEILIIKKGKITDTSFSNIVFSDGKNWVTPAMPLLNGTKRSYLLQTGRINSDEINLNDLKFFKYFRLINAMLDFEEQENFPVTMIQVP